MRGKLIIFPTAPTQTLFSSISEMFSDDLTAFSSPTCQCFRVERFFIIECTGKTKEVLLHLGVFVIPRAWQCHTAPFNSKGSATYRENETESTDTVRLQDGWPLTSNVKLRLLSH